MTLFLMTVGIAQDERGGRMEEEERERERGMWTKKKRGTRQESLAGHPAVTQGRAVVDAEKNITTRRRKQSRQKKKKKKSAN